MAVGNQGDQGYHNQQNQQYINAQFKVKEQIFNDTQKAQMNDNFKKFEEFQQKKEQQANINNQGGQRASSMFSQDWNNQFQQSQQQYRSQDNTEIRYSNPNHPANGKSQEPVNTEFRDMIAQKRGFKNAQQYHQHLQSNQGTPSFVQQLQAARSQQRQGGMSMEAPF